MNALSLEHRLCDLPRLGKVPVGLDAAADRFASFFRRDELRGLVALAERCESLGDGLRELSSGALAGRLGELRSVFRRGARGVEAMLPAALAAVREAAHRQTGWRPFPVQLMGAAALHRGLLVEMATGEGKSLTAALAGVLAGWSGRPCHLVTVNDYLAQRDSATFAPLYQTCGLSVAAVIGEMPPPERQRGHAAGVTYTTGKELLADFLRDRLCLGELQHPARWLIRKLAHTAAAAGAGVVMRGLHTAIVDEADSVLIDEAVTPLIISGSAGNDGSAEAYRGVWQFAAQLEPGLDYRAHEQHREVELRPPGMLKGEAFAPALPALWQASGRRRELIEQALTAREFFHPGKQYVVEDGKVVIVDEFTGRLMPMRKWRNGLHQAIEAREGVEITPMDETLARMSFQRFFRLFRRLAGMTGTASEAAPEFWRLYRLPIVRIPTNRPCQRIQLPDRIFADAEGKLAALREEIVRRHATGQPLLIGTRSIASTEELAAELAACGMETTVLNATRHREEAHIVEGAGLPGRITIATNMAGRGTDIGLGPGVAALGGLHVIATERHESGRIDRQLYGRAGRQGDPGSAQAFLSGGDELLRRFFPAPARQAIERALRHGAPGAGRLASAAFSQAQRRAQTRAFQQRQAVMRQDDWLDESLSFAGLTQR